MTASSTSPLLDQLADLTGLAKIIATGVIRRACLRAGVEPADVTRKDLPRIVDAIGPMLAIYLPPPQAEAKIAELRRFAKT